MRKTEIQKKQIDVKIITTFCDSCKKEILISKYSGFECELSLRIGEINGFEGFVGNEYSVDLCEPCAKNLFFKLLPKNEISINEE